ncbi:3-hexulose-6-phosphate isomerase [Thalictrum thalictroides]|uniref:3-hexulose-6-phosphate isomerase n=1 Tax=Thalictrum thalictroides TaxID=46969 RepID=A0A7J6UXK4_THATH|nr:3-hexulose-6-phosphate isomerase [Thalictrum thalictroides]
MAVEQKNSMSALATKICNQINSVFSNQSTQLPTNALSVIVQEIDAIASKKCHVFIYGVGREGLMLKAFCMRLAHLGLSAHCVGDMTTPPISSSDLLIVSAGPGGFSTVDAICGIARSNGARILVITAQPETGSAVKYATSVAFLPAQTMANDDDQNSQSSLLPMGSVYEGALFVLFEMVVFKLTQILAQTPEAVRSRHTNLE